LELRRSRHWGPNKIEGYLRNYKVQETTPVSHRTIHRILVEAGLNNPISAPRRVWGRRGFQRSRSNELWQSDFKLTEDDEWMMSYLDDHSRFIPGSGIHHNPTAKHAIKLLEESMKEYGKPEPEAGYSKVRAPTRDPHRPRKPILANESERHEKGIGQFETYLTDHDIKHILCRVNHPQTNGKLERFYCVYEQKQHQFKTIDEYVHWHN
jgi:putative transposase